MFFQENGYICSYFIQIKTAKTLFVGTLQLFVSFFLTLVHFFAISVKIELLITEEDVGWVD